MKKHYILLTSALCAALLFSCQKENAPASEDAINQAAESAAGDSDTLEPEEEVIYIKDNDLEPEGCIEATFSANSEEEDTKTNLANGVTRWSAGDQIKVFFSDNSVSTFTIQGGADTKTADFRGLMPAGKTPLYAVYRNDRFADVSGTNVRVNILSSSNGSFASGNIAVAKVADNHSMTFKNVTGFLSFRIPAGIKTVVITSVNGSALAGKLNVACSSTPTAGSIIASASSSITLNVSNTASANTYYLAVAPGITHSKGLTFTYYNTSDEETGVYYLNKTIVTAANTMIPLGTVETERNYYVTVAGAGNGNGMTWGNAMSGTKMMKMLTMAGTDDATDAAKVAAINGSTFHMAAGTYDFGSKRTLFFSESDSVYVTIKGRYNPSTGAQADSATYKTIITGNDEHQALVIRGKLNVTLDALDITGGNLSTTGGALECQAGARVSIARCCIHNNTNTGAGAGLYMNGSKVTVNNCTFKDNSASHGAAVRNVGATASFNRCTFDGNSASVNGGAIYQNSGSPSIALTDCVLSANECWDADVDTKEETRGYGGAINCDGGSLTITGGRFTGNKGWQGSAICYNGSGLVATGTRFDHNGRLEVVSGTTEGTRNGTLYNRSTSTLNNCVFDSNVALYGGALAIYSGTVNISGGTIQNHDSAAGAIDFENATLNVTQYSGSATQFLNNSCTSGSGRGGALLLWAGSEKTATVNITGAVFKGNHSTAEGGVIFGNADANGTLNVTIANSTFGGAGSGEANYSAMDGGALSILRGSYTINNCNFINNYAKNDTWDRTNGDGYGGAIDCWGSASLAVTGGTFSGNKAWRGGAINCNSTGTVSFTGATFKENGTTDETRGGGVAYIQKEVTFTNCTLGGASASDGNKAHWGGALHLVSNAYAKIYGGTIRNNEATGVGGAIEVDYNTRLLVEKYSGSGTQFIGNHSDAQGGAICIETGSGSLTSSITGAIFKGNYGTYGGAIYATTANTTMNISGCTFGGTGDGEPNYTSSSHGGAICIQGTDGITISNSNFTNNYTYSSGDGGAIYTENDCSLTGGTIKGNHARYGGAIFSKGSGKTFSIYGGTYQGNYSKIGGAILTKDYGSLSIAKNSTTRTTFEGNYASNGSNEVYGGAIRFESKNGSFSCTGAIFEENYIPYDGEKEAFGAGISITYDQNGAQVDISQCDFIDNYAASGGGAALSYQSRSGASYGNGEGYMRVSECNFSGNHNNYDGTNNSNYGRHCGAVRLGHDATPSYFDNCTFIGNSTKTVSAEDISTYGGAITYYADGMSYINNCYFEGNYATRGGAISSWGCTASGLYLNACSFSGNYCSYKNGTAIYVSRTKKFCMNNCSFNDNTYSTQTGNDSASWVYVDGNIATGDASSSDTTKYLEECVISNCSLIGCCRTGPSLTVLTNDQQLLYLLDMKDGKTCYLINNIIIDKGNSSHFGWWTNSIVAKGYNNVYSKKGNTNGSYTASGDTGSKAAGDLGSLAWSTDDNTYTWNGTVNGGNTAITASAFATQVGNGSADFKTWLDTTLGVLEKDQCGTTRGSGSNPWWPGAYQEKAGEVLLQAITWNIRSSEMDDTGDHAWSARRGGMCAFINDRQPQIVCMQECEADQRSYLTSNCSGYSAIYDNTSLSWWQQFQGVDKSAEVILYKSSDISVQSSGTFWLVSGAPTSPSKSSTQNAYRSCTWMKCTYKGQKMLVMDVHLSYRTKDNSTPGSSEVIALRQTEMGVIKTWINGHYNASTDGWILFMGDMNTSHWEDIFDEWKDGTYGYFSRDDAESSATGRTFNDWDWENGHVSTIDFQFYKGFPSVKSYKIPTDTYSNVDYLSDHWPVVVHYRML